MVASEALDIVSVGEPVVDSISVEQTELVARLDGKGWEECVRFAYELAKLEGHVE